MSSIHFLNLTSINRQILCLQMTTPQPKALRRQLCYISSPSISSCPLPGQSEPREPNQERCLTDLHSSSSASSPSSSNPSNVVEHRTTRTETAARGLGCSALCPPPPKKKSFQLLVALRSWHRPFPMKHWPRVAEGINCT